MELQYIVTPDDPPDACSVVSARSGVSKSKVKDAMAKGALWVKRSGGKKRRIRRARFELKPGDRISFHYDPDLLALQPPRALCLESGTFFSLWFKPAGLLAQGTNFGDHCSLLRQAEIELGRTAAPYLVHRLDREAEGLILIAHGAKAAGALSRLFQSRKVTKIYRAEVAGDMGSGRQKGIIDYPLDGKPAITGFQVDRFNPDTGTSIVQLRIETGRRHQIRRHLDQMGHPVMGDPRYGRGNKNDQGLKLTAVRLSFHCPFTGNVIDYRLENYPEALQRSLSAKTYG